MRFMLYVEVVTVLNYDLFLFDSFTIKYSMKVGVRMCFSTA